MRSIVRLFAAVALVVSPVAASAQAPTTPSSAGTIAARNIDAATSKTTAVATFAGEARAKTSHVTERGPTATMPGFQMLDDGGSRLFVRLSGPVPVDLQKGKSSLTFVLKGAHVATRNNLRVLETVHFNTPVLRARLVTKKGELHFVVELRADVTPTWKVVEEADKTSSLVIDFPSGSYLEGAPAEAPSEPTP